MQEQHQNLRARLDVCLVTLQGIDNMLAKSALWKFYNNTRLTWVALDQEMVNCRRLKKVTPKYTELVAQFDEYERHFEQWVTMATLIYT